MRVAVCVDDDGGVLFNHRRQSRDSKVCEDLIMECGENPLYITQFSAELFPEGKVQIVAPGESAIPNDGLFFDECVPEDRVEEKTPVTELILYRWNRRYPSDVKLPFEVKDGSWSLETSCDFPGTSHEKITKEVYRKCCEK